MRCNLGPLRRLRHVPTSSLVIYLLFCLIIYNEFLDYFISSLRWSSIENIGPKSNNVRVLFVADPQLIGLNDENMYIGPISRWDSDRYLARTFRMAYSAVQPDVVIFMGDLLDEGSTATRDEYNQYYGRFMKIFKFPNDTKRVYIAGDNDVGGEAFDPYQASKVAQFEHVFNKESATTRVKFVHFIHMYYRFGTSYEKQAELVKTLFHQSEGGVRILLNHMTLLRRQFNEYKEMLQFLQPAIIFTAHSHESHTILCEGCQQHEPSANPLHKLFDWHVHVFPLHKNNFQEIIVPTCSYRMGVPNMGYGQAVIALDGSIRYSVLWVPSRYKQLFIYVITIVMFLSIIVVKRIAITCYKYRSEFFNIS